MSVYPAAVTPITATSDKQAQLNDSTYSVARNSTVASITPAATVTLGQLTSLGFTCAQYFPTFNTTTIPAGRAVQLALNVTAGAAAAGDTLEVRVASASTNKIAGDSLSAQTPLLGSVACPTVAGMVNITLDTALLPRSSAVILVVHSQNERLNTAPSGNQHVSISTMAAAAALRPQLLVPSTGPWSLVGVSPVVESTLTAGTFTQTEPAGVQQGDLLVVCVASRQSVTTTEVAAPAGWTAVNKALNASTATNTAALPCGYMWYCVRGASAPSYVFNTPASLSVLLSRVVAYRGNAATTPLDISSAATTATAITAVNVVGLTTTQDDDLLVSMCAGGQEAAWSSFGANIPGFPSGATDTTTPPSPTTWTERADSNTTSGNDTSLAVFDAVKTAAGATGNLSATASISAGHVVIAGAFKIAPSSPNVSVAATGVSAAALAGTTTASGKINVTTTPTGISASAAIGTPTVTIGAAAVNVTVTPAGVSAAAASGAASGPVSSLVTGWTPGPDRNDFTGEVGARFGIGAADIMVSWIGIYCRTASGTRKLNLYEWFSDTLQRTVTIDLTGKAVGQYVWAPITPITLPANGVYALVQETTQSDGLVWRDTGPVTYVSSLAGSYSCYRVPAGVLEAYQPDTMYAGVDLGIGSAGGGVTVTIGASAAPAGVTALAAAGTATATGVTNVSTTPAGMSAATALGTATATGKINVSTTPAGVTTATALGTVTATGSVGAVNGLSIDPGLVYAVYTEINNSDVIALNTAPPDNPVGYDNWYGLDAAAGVSVTVTPAGVAASGQLGSATTTGVINVSVTPAGVSTAASTGTATATGAAQVAASGVSASAVSGTATATGKQAVTATPVGVSAAAAAGGVSVAVGGGVSTQVSGLALTALTGTATATGKQFVSTSAAGVSAAAQVGTPQVSVSTSVALTGVTAASALGTATALGKQTVAVAAAGVSAATALGGVSVSAGGSIGVAPSGVSASAQAGTPTATGKQAVTVTPAGVSASAQTGNPSASGKINISTMPVGQVVTTALGAVTVTGRINVSVMPVGVAASAQAGTATASAGTTASAAPAGVTAQTQLGTVTASAKINVNVTPAGVWATGTVGTVTVDATTGGVGVWMGTAWQQKPVKVWTGSAWVAKPPKTWTGSAWV